MTAFASTEPEPGSRADVIRTWDARADRYLELFRHELASKPFDRAILAGFAERVGAGGRVCDAGCGPCAHVAAFLADQGLSVLGADVSPRCVQLARREQPGLRFEVLDFRSQILSAPGSPSTGSSRTTPSTTSPRRCSPARSRPGHGRSAPAASCSWPRRKAPATA